MNLTLSEDQQLFLDTTRRVIDAETPMSTVRAWADAPDGFDRAWWRRAADLGWTAMLADEASGGGSFSGRPVADAAIVAEEIGRRCAPGPFLPVNLVAAALGGGDRAAPLVSGESIATWAYAEAPDRWDPNDLACAVEADGDDVVVTGAKAYVEAAGVADQFLVTGRTGDRLTQVLVPAATPGVTVAPGRSLDLSRRFGSVRFDAVRVPRSGLVGSLGGSAEGVERQLQMAVVLQCAETVGVLDEVFTTTLAYMNDRHAFGRPIASYQALKHRVADMLLWLESAKATTDTAIAAIDTDTDDAGLLSSVAKAYVADRAMTIIQDCMQLLGGISQTWEHDIHLFLRRATLSRALYGSPDWHRFRIADRLGF